MASKVQYGAALSSRNGLQTSFPKRLADLASTSSECMCMYKDLSRSAPATPLPGPHPPFWTHTICTSPCCLGTHETISRIYSTLQCSRRHWTRQTHGTLFNSHPNLTNILFGTMLLGLQRLETAGVLPPAHYSMLEEMLEGWTFADSDEALYDS